MGNELAENDYRELIERLKRKVVEARSRSYFAVNSEMVLLYWSIGRDILERQSAQGWGSKVIERLSRDLRRAFPEMRGFSVRNLRYMRTFAEVWPDLDFVQQAVAQVPWGHSLRLIDKVRDPDALRFYVAQTMANGWSRDVLVLQIESQLYERQGQALTNFAETLPPPQSDLAQQITKDPYCFDFLTLSADAQERDLEAGLIEHIRNFLIELGIGFAFVGSQVHIEVGDQDFYLDLLFYHLSLRCFVVVDLKSGPFAPEHAGKMNFYLSAVDAQLRHADDQPSIGMLLCKSRNELVVEYALRDMSKPIGVANWETQLVESLPEGLEGRLPSVEEVEAELLASEE